MTNIIKMVVIPIIGAAIVIPLYALEAMVRYMQSQEMAIIMLLCWASPTSLQLLIVCSMRDNQEENISKLFLFMWSSSVIFLTISTSAMLILVNSA